MPESDVTSNISLLVTGKTGVGKSSTSNSIIGREEFKVDFSTDSVTKTCQSADAQQQGQTVKVVDMPGLYDANLTPEKNNQNIVEKAVEAVAETPDGYDAILMVVRLGRFSLEDKNTVAYMKAIFGETFLKDHGILVVTHGDQFPQDARNSRTFQQWCSQQTGPFKELVQEVNGRVVLFHNKSDDQDVRRQQLEELFKMVEKVKRNHRYTPRLFERAAAERKRIDVASITQNTEAEIDLLYEELKDLANGTSTRDVEMLTQLLNRTNSAESEIRIQDGGREIFNNVFEALDKLRIAIEARIQAVKQGIEAEHRRAEDERRHQQAMQDAENRRTEAERRHQREMAEAERSHQQAMQDAENRRIEADRRHQREMAEAERSHQQAMQDAENRRIEADRRHQREMAEAERRHQQAMQEMRDEQERRQKRRKEILIKALKVAAIALGIGAAVAVVTVTIVYSGPILAGVAVAAKAAAPVAAKIAKIGLVSAALCAA